MGEKQELLRKIPKIDEVLQDERLIFFMEKTPRSVVVEAVRQQINELRNGILQGSIEQTAGLDEIVEGALKQVRIRKNAVSGV